MQFLHRYLFVVSEQAQHMRLAAESRGSAGGSRFRRWRVRAATGALAVLFARSYNRAEGTYRAMLSRSFEGRLHLLVPHTFGWKDGLRPRPGSISPLGAETVPGIVTMTQPLIEVQNLSFRYPDGTLALDGVDFVLHAGESVAVFGPNGSGKTTFVLHLNGLLVGEGSVSVCGLPVTRQTLPVIRRKVGLVFQDPDEQLFMPTVLEDVAFGPLNLGRAGRSQFGWRSTSSDWWA